MNKILETIEKYNMLPQGSNVIVALSGGADSVTLLHFLYSNKDSLNINLEAAHINHNIRGEEALRDQNFVDNLCKTYNIKLHIFSEDIPFIAKTTGESLEECGRRIRYERLNSIDDTSLIATAHNLDDSAETAIINLLRGTGIKGLCGINPIFGRIIRPLIDCTKNEIIDYCKNNSLEYVFDSTNAINDYTRNRIRNTVFPIFKEINPAFLNTFSRMSCILKEEADFIKESAEALVQKSYSQKKSYSVTPLLNAHSALRKAAIAIIIKNLTGVNGESLHILKIDDILKNGGYVNLPTGKIIKSDGIFLSEHLPVQHEKETFCQIEINELKKEYKLNKKTLFFDFLSKEINKSQKINNQVFINRADYDTIIGNLVLRTRKNGDKVRFFSQTCTKSLKKLFNEAKIPLSQRDELLILADDLGIVWVEGFGVSLRCSIKENTKKILEINIEKGGT